jgi:hypothetical protein
MTSTTESPKSKQKLQTLTLSIDHPFENSEDVTTEIAGGELSASYLLSLEEEDMRLQYKHLNIVQHDRSEVSDDL